MAAATGKSVQHIDNLIRFYRVLPEGLRNAWAAARDQRFTFAVLHKLAVAAQSGDDAAVRAIIEQALNVASAPNAVGASHRPGVIRRLGHASTTKRRYNKRTTLIRLVRGGGQLEDLELGEVYEAVDRILADLRALAHGKRVRLDPKLERQSAEDVVVDGLRHFAIYHSNPAVTRRGDRLFTTDRNLLFYYQDRLEGFAVWPEPELSAVLSPARR